MLIVKQNFVSLRKHVLIKIFFYKINEAFEIRTNSAKYQLFFLLTFPLCL